MKVIKNKHMKQTGFIAIIMLFLVVMSCKKESDMYSFFRQTHPKNLKTLADGEFYSWAASDSAVIRADYFLNVQGEITTYGDSIIAYGHCWSKNNSNPSIGNDFDTIYNISILPGNKSTFVSYLSNLEADTEYNVRSFALIRNAQGTIDTGYNPVVTQISTLPAINQWFEQTGELLRPGNARFDAVAFNLGDTMFFGTGNQGNEQLQQDIWMFDPVTGEWELLITNLVPIYLPLRGESRNKLTNAVGFALTYHEKNAPEGVMKRCIYVGLGDFGGFDDRNDKTMTIVEYDLEDMSFRTIQTDYTGGFCSGAVSFTIGSKAYVGTGSGLSTKYTWHVFDPVAEFDGDALTAGWRTINIPGGNVGRTGAIAFSINGRGYFGLGKDANGNFLKDFWEFRPDVDGYDGTWLKKADFPGEKRQNAAAFVVGTQGYVGTGDNIVGDMETEGGIISGQTFSDVYRYDPFNNKWTQKWTQGDVGVRDYTLDKIVNTNNPKYVTRTCGFNGSTFDYGFIGFGIMPEELQRAQEDYWKYQPWEAN